MSDQVVNSRWIKHVLYKYQEKRDTAVGLATLGKCTGPGVDTKIEVYSEIIMDLEGLLK